MNRNPRTGNGSTGPLTAPPEPEEDSYLVQSDFEAEKQGAGTQRSIVDRLRVVWMHRRFLFRFTALGLVLFTVVAFLIPKRFTSTTRLMPPDQQSGMGAMVAALAGKAGGLGSLAGDVLGQKSSGDLFVGVLKSRTVQDNLISKFDLRKVYWQAKWEDARKELEKRTDVSQERKSGIITIKVIDNDPRRASAMGQEYVAQLNLVVNSMNMSAASKERVFLEQRLKQVNSDLEQAEKEFSQFASKNTAIDIKEQGRAMVEAAAVLQGQLIAAQSELEGLKQIYTANNVRVRSTQARIEELQLQLQKLGGADNSSSASGQDKDGALYPSIRKLPLLGVTYADLYRRTKVNEVVFETLTQQYEMAKVAEAKDTPSVKVLDPADVPERKSYPPRLVIMLLGASLAFVVGVIVIFVVEMWQALDTRDPLKEFADEVGRSLSVWVAKLPRTRVMFVRVRTWLWR